MYLQEIISKKTFVCILKVTDKKSRIRIRIRIRIRTKMSRIRNTAFLLADGKTRTYK